MHFDEVIKPLVRLVSEDLSDAERSIEFHVQGDSVILPATQTTALAVTLNELMQNAVQHAFSDISHIEMPKLTIMFKSSQRMLKVTVSDNGLGLPLGFSKENYGLGLTIVRNLIEMDLAGSIEIRRAESGGTKALIRIPISQT